MFAHGSDLSELVNIMMDILENSHVSSKVSALLKCKLSTILSFLSKKIIFGTTRAVPHLKTWLGNNNVS